MHGLPLVYKQYTVYMGEKILLVMPRLKQLREKTVGLL